jgi:hypothetical protein
MVLADFSLLVDAPPKWVLNTRAVLGAGVRYSLAVAERLALARVLNRDLAIPLPKAWELAGSALGPVASDTVEFTAGDGTVTVIVDLYRLRAALAVRRAELATMSPRRRAGRKPRRTSDALAAAERYGLDIGLLKANLTRSPDERLRQLDAMGSFRSRVRRKG